MCKTDEIFEDKPKENMINMMKQNMPSICHF